MLPYGHAGEKAGLDVFLSVKGTLFLVSSPKLEVGQLI